MAEPAPIYLPIIPRPGPPMTRIAYSVAKDWTRVVNTALPDGSQQRELLSFEPVGVITPVWSPDASRIAFNVGYSDLYVANADGSGAIKVAQGTTTPTWSPDGTTLLFSARDDNPPELHLFRMPATGGPKVQLTFSTGQTNYWADEFPSWSPDGQHIVFQRRQGSQNPQIYIMNADGSNLQALTAPDICATSPTWSPDGQLIAFAIGCTLLTGQDVYTMRPDGSQWIRRTFNNAGGGPTWAPDGRWIALTDTSIIGILELATGRIQRLSVGREIAFLSWASR